MAEGWNPWQPWEDAALLGEPKVRGWQRRVVRETGRTLGAVEQRWRVLREKPAEEQEQRAIVDPLLNRLKGVHG